MSGGGSSSTAPTFDLDLSALSVGAGDDAGTAADSSQDFLSMTLSDFGVSSTATPVTTTAPATSASTSAGFDLA